MSGREPEERVRVPVLRQSWTLVGFLHWAVPVDSLAPKLPPGLYPDLVDGRAWIAITPMLLTDVRPPALPAVPKLSTFPETNVRTYVRTEDGAEGLHFLSLDAHSTPTVAGGRALYGVPYHRAVMSVESADGVIHYSSRRRTGGDGPGHEISIRPGEALGADEVEPFVHHLTGRWRALTRRWRRTWSAPVEHPPWPLHRARIEKLDESLLSALGFDPPSDPPLVHWSPGVPVRLGRPKRPPAP